ncbi:MAG TPA: MFS transporter [Acidimicrobiales bacterium]
MPTDDGWEPLSKPARRSGAARFVVTPFVRLARTHAGAVAGDTLIALALANSLFFDIDPNAARSRVALYLALTMAPFAVVAPLIGPALDRARGGRRLMVIGANALRAVICLLMIGDLDSMLLFPEAFAVLVLAKSYHVAKSAIVPTVVRSDAELVAANSRLSFLSGVVGFAAAIPGGLAFLVAGSEGVLVLAVAVFAVAAVLGLRIPPTKVALDHTSETEREELRGGGIVLAASAMGLMRGIVGFLTFLIAFALRTDDAPTYQFGIVIAASGIGALIGALVAPVLRRNDMAEERILQTVLGLTALAGLLAAWGGGIVAAAALALTIGAAAGSGKLAFDAVVQRDAPDANRGRSFARFETRFQLTWVVGAFIPVVASIPMEIGFLVIAGCAAFALFSYLAGLRALERGEMPARRSPATALARRVRRRRQGFAGVRGASGAGVAGPGDVPPGGDMPAGPAAAWHRLRRSRRSAAHRVEPVALAQGAAPDDPPRGGRPAPPPPPPPPPPAPVPDAGAEQGAASGGAGDDPDRRVVIDPTNLQ